MFVRVSRSVFAVGVAAAVVSLLSTSSVSAATLSLSSGGVTSTLPGNFNPTGIAAINADGINVGTAITIFSDVANTGGLFVSPQNVSVTFDFMGKEAGFTNALISGSNVLFNNNVAPGITSGPLSVNSGVVPFLFRAITPGNLDAVNGGTIASGLQIAFARVSDSIFYAFFDDGGAGPDADFDDMVVRITARDLGGGTQATTPLPATLPLFATGLGALGLFGLRRKRKAA